MATTTKKTPTQKQSSSESKPTKPETTNRTAGKPYTAADLAKEVGLRNAALARRYLRAAKVQRPKDGWRWADKTAAKSAIEAVQKALKAEGA